MTLEQRTDANVTAHSGIEVLDTRMHGWPGMTAVYLIPGPRPAIVDTGPGSSIDTTLAALEEAGVDTLAWIVLTHIHIDHAGAAGHLARRFPEAKVVVRQEGARHMADPSKLWASAARLHPDNMTELWGQMLPIDPHRIVAIDSDGPAVDLGGGRRLEATYAPGHAKHQMALLDSDSGSLFVGDALGVWLPEASYMRPAAAPPEFSLELTMQTIDRLVDLDAETIFPTHYGPVPDRDRFVEEARRRFHEWVQAAEPVVDSGGALEELIEAFRARRDDFYPGLDPAIIPKFEYIASYELNARGILRYLEKRREAAEG